MRKIKYGVVIILLVLFIPIIEIETVNEDNGTTTLDYKNLLSYGIEYFETHYVSSKENTPIEKKQNESRDDDLGDSNISERK